MNIHDVLRRLPHRYPFLLVDRVLESVPGEYLLAMKNVTVNEPFFPGHFPVKPVMPGVLVLEALAQATGLLAMETTPELVAPDSLYYLVGIDNARFKRPVEPGDQLFLKATLVKRKREIWVFATEASVDGKPVASADIMCTQRVA